MPAHASIGINNDLAAGEAGVAHRTTNDEAAGRIDVILGVLVEQVAWDYGLDDILENLGAQLVIAHQFGVLSGNYDRVNTEGFAVGIVLDSHLGFAIRPQVRTESVLANFGEAVGKFVSEQNRSWHQFGVFIHGKAEHHALVARAPGIDTHGNVAGLLVDAGDHGAGVAIKTIERVVVANGLDDATYQGLEVHVGFGRDFSGDDHEAGCGQGLASDAAEGVFGQAGVV